MILSYSDGNIVAKLDLVNQDVPMMSVYKDKCLVVSKLGKEAQYLETKDGGSLKDRPFFDLESNTPLVSIQLVDNEYVVAVFETFVKIFKASNGQELQKLGFLDKRAQQTMKYRYKLSQINPAESEIILLANNTKEAKGTVQSEIYVMREITYEE